MCRSLVIEIKIGRVFSLYRPLWPVYSKPVINQFYTSICHLSRSHSAVRLHPTTQTKNALSYGRRGRLTILNLPRCLWTGPSFIYLPVLCCAVFFFVSQKVRLNFRILYAPHTNAYYMKRGLLVYGGIDAMRKIASFLYAVVFRSAHLHIRWLVDWLLLLLLLFRPLSERIKRINPVRFVLSGGLFGKRFERRWIDYSDVFEGVMRVSRVF